MINKPTNWDEIKENGSRKLEMGGYVAIIRKVTDLPENSCFEVEYDIAEGDFKGIAITQYEMWGNWNFKFRVYYSEKTLWRFKKFITRVEATNPNFTFDWKNLNCLVNKGIGLIIGMRQYYGRDGSLKEAPEVQDFCTATDVRSGNIPTQPKITPPKKVQAYQESTPAYAVDTSDELPF